MVTTTSETSPRFSSRGDAYYVLDENTVRSNIIRLRTEFKSRYPNFEIGYSFKTNYLRRICEIAKEEGCYAEVVSPYEHKYAKALGFGNRIIYNGVTEDADGKAEAAANGEIVNVDNKDELYNILVSVAKAQKNVALGIRANFDILNGVTSRFGTDIHGTEFWRMWQQLKTYEGCRFAGFHCHIGTARPVNYWMVKTVVMAMLAKRYEAEYIDIGGGMYGHMEKDLAKQFPEYVPDFELYAEPISNVMNRFFPDRECKLFIEPGTAIVGDAMAIEAKVTNIKDVRGKKFVTLACNSNHTGIIADNKKLIVRVIKSPDVADYQREKLKDACIAGNTCLEYDYIRDHVDLEVGVGDYIHISNVGAYSISSSRQFIVPRLPVYNTQGELLREGESYWDMFGLYEKAGKKE